MSDSAHRVLIVDDNPANLLLAREVLGLDGYGVEEAGSAEDAREILKGDLPDLILMDIQLPGMDGLEFTRELKSDPRTAVVPVIALTAHSMPIYERAAQAAGCDGFIMKTGNPLLLAAEVKAFLEARRTSA